MLHKYERKPKVRHKPTKIPTFVIQKAAPPFVWEMPKACITLRGAFFTALHTTKKMRLDRDIDKLMAQTVDTTGLTILREEDLKDGKTVQDYA